MLVYALKEEIFENIINNESENYQKILETETKIETKDQLALESIEILTEFQRDFQSAVNSCKERHIKDKNKDVFLECEVEQRSTSVVSPVEEKIKSGKMHLYFNTTEEPFSLRLNSNLVGHWVFKKCEIDNLIGVGPFIECGKLDGERSLYLIKETGMVEYTNEWSMQTEVGTIGTKSNTKGYCSKSEKKDIF